MKYLRDKSKLLCYNPADGYHCKCGLWLGLFLISRAKGKQIDIWHDEFYHEYMLEGAEKIRDRMLQKIL